MNKNIMMMVLVPVVITMITSEAGNHYGNRLADVPSMLFSIVYITDAASNASPSSVFVPLQFNVTFQLFAVVFAIIHSSAKRIHPFVHPSNAIRLFITIK